MVAVDSTFFPYLFNHKTRVPIDRTTKKPVEHVKERISLLIETLQEDGETIIIPAPALSEFLILARESGPAYLDMIAKSSLYDVKPFDEMAAVELAAIRLKMEKSLNKKELKKQTPEQTWAKISFDRQIVTIAKIHNAHTIYSEDDGVHRFAKANQITPVRIWELPKPKEVQAELFGEDAQTAADTTYSNVAAIADRRGSIESGVSKIEVKGDE